MGRGRRAKGQSDFSKAQRLEEVFDQLRVKEQSDARLQADDLGTKTRGSMADATKEPADTGEKQ